MQCEQKLRVIMRLSDPGTHEERETVYKDSKSFYLSLLHASSGKLAGTPEIMFNTDRCKVGGQEERRRGGL